MTWPDWIEPPRSLGEWIAFALAPFAMAGVVALLVLAGAGALDTCSRDDPCHRSAYRVINDTPRAVYVFECGHHCGKGDGRYGGVELRPGEATSVAKFPYDVAPIVGGGWTWFEVATLADRQLGCLVLDGYDEDRDGGVVRLSAATPCRKSAPLTPLVSPGRLAES